MLEQLPEFIDLLQCAEKRREFKGEMALSSLPRLVGVLAESSGSVAVSLAFDKQDRQAVLQGHVSTVLRLTCQNCLETFDWPVQADFNLGIVASPDEANLLPETLEPLLIGEGKTSLKEIVEEELLLSIPAFPKHPEGNCFINKTWSGAGSAAQDEPVRTDNPFSILAKLKNTGDS